MAKVIDYDSVERNFQKAKKINPPPPDVVEAARRLEEIFKDYDGWSKQYAVTVCKWVLEKASGTS